MVEIPLRDNFMYGIVAHLFEISSDMEILEIKEIKNIAIGTPILHSKQIQTLIQYAEKHAIHIHKVISLFLPTPVRKRILKYG